MDDDAVFAGELARLRALTEVDLPSVLELRNDPGTMLATSRGVPTPVDGAWARRFLARATDAPDAGVFAVTDLQTRRFAGICGYRWVSTLDGVVTVEVSLMPTAVRMGYGTDALGILVRYLRDQAHAVVVRAGYVDPNPGARRAAEKVGFTEIGRLRDHVWREGRWHDVVELEILPG